MVEVVANPRAGALSALVFALAFCVLLVGRVYSGAGDTLPAELLPWALLHNGGPDSAASSFRTTSATRFGM